MVDDEDEVLIVLADQLGEFVPYVGAEHAHCLLDTMEQLMGVEDSTVRDKVCSGGAKRVNAGGRRWEDGV